MDKLLSGRSVLVVEDEMLLAMMIADMLGDLGCTSVAIAATIDQAVALIEGQIFDAAMLDMNLQGHHSLPVANALAARNVPFLFCTGNSTIERTDDFRDRAILRKPFKSAQLTDLFARLLPPLQ